MLRSRSGSTTTRFRMPSSRHWAITTTGGGSVALSGDTLVAGAPGEDSSATGIDGDQTSNDRSVAGAAYVFLLPPVVVPALPPVGLVVLGALLARAAVAPLVRRRGARPGS